MYAYTISVLQRIPLRMYAYTISVLQRIPLRTYARFGNRAVLYGHGVEIIRNKGSFRWLFHMLAEHFS
jgi:hypothetical protein